MPRPIVAMAKRYQKDALRIETIGEREAHADIAYQAVAVSPTDIEHVVVNILRLHEAETAILFCATREAVRRLHASLTERGFQAVALSGEHSQSERNNALKSLRDTRARVCVATDVAARGIDLPSVSLVIHVELPRDAEALQHRSGRTGRAGRKGVAVLIVPYRRRRAVETMLRNARIQADWIDPPSAEQVHAKDRERLLEKLMAPVETEDDDGDLVRQLVERLSPEAMAAALVRSLKTDLPAPEDIIASSSKAEAGDAGPRAGFEDATWFRINAGRRHNADPRWLLPLICRYGHVVRNDIGAIRIAANESYFQVTKRATPGFIKALRKATIAPQDDGMVIDQAPPREVAAAAQAPRSQRPSRPAGKPHRPAPRKGRKG
jgi:ATP-dependent RNA helicase DeaD